MGVNRTGLGLRVFTVFPKKNFKPNYEGGFFFIHPSTFKSKSIIIFPQDKFEKEIQQQISPTLTRQEEKKVQLQNQDVGFQYEPNISSNAYIIIKFIVNSSI